MTLYALAGERPQLPDEGDYWIAPTASVIGKVRLERQASVWFGAVLRGDNELIHIGERSNIQDGCVLHTDMGFPLTVARNVTVGHQACLHGCTIEEGALIGMGATVLNGAVIGRGSIIGAHALIPEGKVIPPQSLVMGMPGKVVKQISNEQAAGLAGLAQIYVDRQAEYLCGLAELSQG
jgi:carbonic anhydrase/acetyltransferase-like protein (isoleucine patch superfamily)